MLFTGHNTFIRKVLKLETISYEEIDNLQCRGIKSSMSDPIQVIQSILDKVFSHLLFFVEEQFFKEFNMMSPSITGVEEAIERLKDPKFGDFSTGIILESDFKNMYSNINVTMLKKYVKIASNLAGFSEDSITYINNLIDVNMNHSYFKEPNGIHHTEKGFSMGDKSASRGSEVVLRTSELDTYRELKIQQLLQNAKLNFRFKDDVFTFPTGSIEQCLKVLEIVVTGYPSELQLNTKVNIVKGKFLNLRIYNVPGVELPYHTILRKRNSKYDIIPKSSNTASKYKKCAGRTYIQMTRTHCSDKKEQLRQIKVVDTILKHKNYSSRQIKMLFKKRRKKIPFEKVFTGTVEHDNVSNIHKHIRNLFKESDIDTEIYSLPMTVPGKKLLQYVFTLKKLKRKLNI